MRPVEVSVRQSSTYWLAAPCAPDGRRPPAAPAARTDSVRSRSGARIARCGPPPDTPALGSWPSADLVRALLGDLARVAARTITAFIRTTVGERGLSVGIVVVLECLTVDCLGQLSHRWSRAIAMVTPYRPLRAGPDIVLARKRADPWERIYALEEELHRLRACRRLRAIAQAVYGSAAQGSHNPQSASNH